MLLGILLSGPPSSPFDFMLPYVGDTPRQTIFLGVVTLVAGLLQVIIPRIKFREYREITYRVIFDEPVIVPAFNNTYLVQIRLSNTGPLSIDVGDYAWLRILFPGRKIVPGYPPSVTDQTGTVIDDTQLSTLFTIHPTIAEEDRIVLSPFLFQPREAFTVSAFVIGSRGGNPTQVSAKFRPVGKAYPPRITFVKFLRIILIVFFSLTIIWALSLVQSNLPFGTQPDIIITLIGYTLLLIIGFIILYRLKIIKL